MSRRVACSLSAPGDMTYPTLAGAWHAMRDALSWHAVVARCHHATLTGSDGSASGSVASGWPLAVPRGTDTVCTARFGVRVGTVASERWRLGVRVGAEGAAGFGARKRGGQGSGGGRHPPLIQIQA